MAIILNAAGTARYCDQGAKSCSVQLVRGRLAVVLLLAQRAADTLRCEQGPRAAALASTDAHVAVVRLQAQRADDSLG